ncbi:MAG: hypothetical protein CVV08_11350 [Gammaproteobacteria bacterium HGW-Gammaproteobacteria-12]|nr:MAG: hypothetical protein CVV08_11350 [Gammaproteobacteria bacterium HGW-Gammaproteobacteria-12]
MPGAEYPIEATSGQILIRPQGPGSPQVCLLGLEFYPAFFLVALRAFWYKAALFSRGPVLALSSAPGKTLEKRGAERQ